MHRLSATWLAISVLLVSILACGSSPSDSDIQSAAETMIARTAAAATNEPDSPPASEETTVPEEPAAAASDQPTEQPTQAAVGTSRTSPAKIGDPMFFAKLGTVTVTASDWVPGQAGRVILSLTLVCELSPDESCNTISLVYDVVGSSATVYDQVFDSLVPDPDFYLQEVFGGGTVTGYMGFSVETEDTLVLRLKPIVDFANQDRYVDLNPD